MVEIPLRKTYPKDTNDSTSPWYVPKTIGILPDDVRSHARIHDAMAMAHDHTRAQAHLLQMTQHLEALDLLTAELYATHTSTTPPSSPKILIPRTPQARQLINKACASWKKGVEQLMVTSKLVTVYKPRNTTTGPSKRKVKQSKRTQTDDDRVTYREPFNIIDTTLARHGLIGTTLKQSLPTRMNVNRPHLDLLNKLIKYIVDKHSDIHVDLHALNRQQ